MNSKRKKKTNKIPSDLFWKWRYAEETLAHDETRQNLAEMAVKAVESEALFVAQKKEIAESSVRNAKTKVEASSAEYNDIKSEIENVIGRPLTDCEIDTETFEVKEAP